MSDFGTAFNPTWCKLISLIATVTSPIPRHMGKDMLDPCLMTVESSRYISRIPKMKQFSDHVAHTRESPHVQGNILVARNKSSLFDINFEMDVWRSKNAYRYM